MGRLHFSTAVGVDAFTLRCAAHDSQFQEPQAALQQTVTPAAANSPRRGIGAADGGSDGHA